MNKDELYSVKDVCDRYGITRKTLFYYDRSGLLKPAKRQGSQQFKYYDDVVLSRLETILKYRAAGLSIREIKEVLDLSDIDSIITILNNVKIRLEEEKNQKEKELEKLDRLIIFIKNTSDIL